MTWRRSAVFSTRCRVALAVRGEATTTRLERVDGGSMCSAIDRSPRCRLVDRDLPLRRVPTSWTLGRRRRDLERARAVRHGDRRIAALWLSGIAARQLARPIGTLREAALAMAGGARMPPLEAEPTDEFRPVFTAFRRMATDLNASRTALEEAQRRTTAVLRNVASGVVAVDARGRVSLANPRAETLLGGSLAGGRAFARCGADGRSRASLSVFSTAPSDEEEFEIVARSAAAARHADAARARRRRGDARRRDRAGARAARARVGRDGAAGRARDQESAHSDPTRRAASASRARRRARRLRSRARAERQADSRRDRPAR